MLISKTTIAGVALLIGARAQPQARDLEGLLPPPTWVFEHAEELGLTEAELQPLRDVLQGARREMAVRRSELQELRRAFRDSLGAPALDRVAIENHFEELLAAENELKRLQLGARLDFLTSVTVTQRAAVREGAARLAGQRVRLRNRIEEIRGLGRRLHRRGEDTSAIRDEVRAIERLIRAGSVEAALDRCDLLTLELRVSFER